MRRKFHGPARPSPAAPGRRPGGVAPLAALLSAGGLALFGAGALGGPATAAPPQARETSPAPPPTSPLRRREATRVSDIAERDDQPFFHGVAPGMDAALYHRGAERAEHAPQSTAVDQLAARAPAQIAEARGSKTPLADRRAYCVASETRDGGFCSLVTLPPRKGARSRRPDSVTELQSLLDSFDVPAFRDRPSILLIQPDDPPSSVDEVDDEVLVFLGVF